MPGEEKDEAVSQGATAEEETPVTDDDLLRAAAEAESRMAEKPPEAKPAEEVKAEETPPEPEKTPEPEKPPEELPPAAEVEETPPKVDDEDHRERTKLGRKVAKLEDALTAITEQNKQLLEVLSKTVAKPAPDAAPDASELSEAQIQERYDELHAESPFKANQFLRQVETSRTIKATTGYQTGYKGSLDGWKDKAGEDESAGEIYKLLTDPKSEYNRKHTADPNADFTVNLARAEAHYWREKAKSGKAAEKTVPVQNAKPKAPLGVAGEGKGVTDRGPKKVAVSPAVAEYARRTGMSEEEVQAALTQPVPMSFNRRR